MIKKILKIVGILSVGGFAIGLIWYFQGLKIDGDPLFKTCWAVDIYDNVTGEKVVGAEDLDFDPETGTIFLSAYDRRAVDRELVAGGPVTTQGGIYTFTISDIDDSGTLNVTDISRAFKEAGNEFRPHGFMVAKPSGATLHVINRIYSDYNGRPTLEPTIHRFRLQPFFKYSGDYMGRYCDPYDLDFFDVHKLISDKELICERVREDGLEPVIVETIKSTNWHGTFSVLELEGFPNGLAIIGRDTNPNLVVALTRKNKLQFFDIERLFEFDESAKIPLRSLNLPIAPDNLTVDANDNLYVAGFPNLLDYYFYTSELFGVTKSPSAAYRISPDDYAQDLLFKDDGTMISGATVAQRAGDYLILGSGWDDNIAICSGMDRIS